MTQTKKTVLPLLIALLVGICMLIPMQTYAAGLQGYPSISNIGKTSFQITYYSKKPGTYKAELWKVKGNNLNKKAYINTFTFKCSKTNRIKEYPYSATIKFKKATSKTWYAVFPRTKGYNASMPKKTK